MTEEELRRGVRIQQALSSRLAEFAYADPDRASRISRHLAEVAVKGNTLGNEMVPLFLEMAPDNPAAVAQVALAIKLQLEELTDALLDLRQELPDWAEFFSEMARR